MDLQLEINIRGSFSRNAQICELRSSTCKSPISQRACRALMLCAWGVWKAGCSIINHSHFRGCESITTKRCCLLRFSELFVVYTHEQSTSLPYKLARQERQLSEKLRTHEHQLLRRDYSDLPWSWLEWATLIVILLLLNIVVFRTQSLWS